jgi:hypothetical protein
MNSPLAHRSFTSVVDDEPMNETHRLSPGGVALGIATLAVFLVALAIRGPAVLGLAVLAVVFVPLEKVFALPNRSSARGGPPTSCTSWSTIC